MAKGKQLEDSSRKAHKKVKKAKSSKSSSASKSSTNSATTGNINRKQIELARVYNLKCELLLHGGLSYLEYQELREEIGRLNALKETLASQMKSL